MDLTDIPALVKYFPLALAVAFIIEAVKQIPYVEHLFYNGNKIGKTIMLFLPFALGIAGAFVMKAYGEPGDPLIRGICAGGLSTLLYDMYKNAVAKKALPGDNSTPPKA
jgi:riboflavin transporter FmnP